MEKNNEITISINNLLVLTEIIDSIYAFYNQTKELSIDDIKIIKRLYEKEEIKDVLWLKKRIYPMKYLIDRINIYSDIVNFSQEIYNGKKEGYSYTNNFKKEALYFIKYLTYNKNNLNIIKVLLLELKENEKINISLNELDNLLTSKNIKTKKLCFAREPSYYQ